MEFKEKRYKCSLEELEIRIKKMNTIQTIMDSELSDEEKIEKLVLLYKNAETFRRSYSLFIKFGYSDNRLDCIRTQLDNFDNYYIEFKRLESKAAYARANNQIQLYIDNFDYAKSVVKFYIESPNSYKEYDFYRSLNLNEKEFDFCVDIIKKMDPDLYILYLEKRQKNSKIRCFKNIETIKTLSGAIEDGSFSDGTPFNELEFIKRIPFKRSINFMFVLCDFLKRNNPKEMKSILRYVYSIGMDSPSFFKPLDKEYFYNAKIIYNGIEISNEDNDIIFDYMTVNDLPYIYTVYKIIRDKYTKGEIIKEDVEKQKIEQMKHKHVVIKKTLKMNTEKEA